MHVGGTTDAKRLNYPSTLPVDTVSSHMPRRNLPLPTAIVPGRMAFVPLCVAVALMATGCDRKGATRAPDGQVAARVNDADITVHQVEHVLQRQARAYAGAGEAAGRRALDQLVEQELAAQAAREQGLDREAAVVQALEAARREVLARAWQDRLAQSVVRPSSDEIDRYYAEHPALFGQRRIYVLKEFLVEAAREGDAARIQQIAREARGARAVEDALVLARLRFRAREFPQSAEELPMALLEPMAQLDVGQSLVLPQAQGVRVFTLLHVEAAPVDRHTATEPIEAFLTTERKRRAVAEGMKPIREKARIELRGGFAPPASAPASGNR